MLFFFFQEQDNISTILRILGATKILENLRENTNPAIVKRTTTTIQNNKTEQFFNH